MTRAALARPIAACLLLAVQASAAAGQEPRFLGGVNRLLMDVTVVDAAGRPVKDLSADEFQVDVDGERRPAMSAVWVALDGTDRSAAPRPPVPEGYSINDRAGNGRLIVLVIDQPSLPFGGTRWLRAAMDRFLDRLAPTDLVSAVGLGANAPSTPFTTDRARVRQALARMNGQRDVGLPFSQHAIDLASAIAIARGDPGLLDRFAARDCSRLRTPAEVVQCTEEIRQEATSIARSSTQEGEATIRGLDRILRGLAAIEAPKTIVIVSEGFALDGGPIETNSRLVQLGRLAAAARASVYVLHVDDQTMDIDRMRPSTVQPSGDDRRTRREVLETLAGASRGALFNVTGTGDAVFERMTNELAGYYVLGVEGRRDDPTAQRALKVSVSRPGMTVRARRLLAEAGPGFRSSREAAAAALSSPIMLTALPLKTITFNLQDKDPTNVQVLIHVDVGEAYSTPEDVAVAYAILDKDGRTADSKLFSGRLAPTPSGLALPLPYVAGAQLPPGEYRLKLAAAIGDKVGSVEHEIHAVLGALGPLKLSDLTVGGPVPIDEPTAPTIDAVVRFGVVHGYLEAYGPGASAAAVRFEVSETDRAPALLTENVTGRAVGDTRAVFSRMVPIGKLPPGWYRLRAVVSSGAETTTLSRAFEVEDTGRLTRAGAAGDGGAPRELFLPVTVAELAPPFTTADALRESVRQPFAARVPAATASWWDKGLQALERSDYQAAETNFKEAIVPDVDTTAALAYLGVTYAASGHDTEATSVWQTALADGRDLPQLYAWLGAAQLRIHALPAARSTLEEAAGRWPSDPRFTKALALLYASTGRGRDAVQMLERHLSASPDPATLEIALGWIYEAHARGAVVHTAAEDLALARRYADQYAQANGPRQPLVAQWLEALETSLR